MTGRIVALCPSPGETDLLDQLAEVRARRDVPLIGDDRWSPEHWQQVVDAATAEPVPTDTAWAAATSGSSGRPKIVLRSERSWSDSFPVIEDLLGVGPDDVIALPAPPVSSLTLFSLAHALAGGPRPAPAKHRGFVAEDFAEATCFHGTPQAFAALLAAGPPVGLRAALVGGSTVEASLRRHARELGIEVVAYYGAAELSFVAIDRGEGLTPFPGVEVELRDGELWVQSPYLAEGFVDGPICRDGDWATAGDLASITDGRMQLRGRSDGAILASSATVVPEEVEIALRGVPGVGEVVVLGLPMLRVGTLVAAVIEPDGSRAMDVSALRDAARRSLAPAHRPRRWYVGRLARTPSGKPRRDVVLTQVESGEVSLLES